MSHASILYFGVSLPTVGPSPDPCLTMLKYGVGRMTDDEYRDEVRKMQADAMARS